MTTSGYDQQIEKSWKFYSNLCNLVIDKAIEQPGCEQNILCCDYDQLQDVCLLLDQLALQVNLYKSDRGITHSSLRHITFANGSSIHLSSFDFEKQVIDAG